MHIKYTHILFKDMDIAKQTYLKAELEAVNSMHI